MSDSSNDSGDHSSVSSVDSEESEVSEVEDDLETEHHACAQDNYALLHLLLLMPPVPHRR